MSEPGNQPMMQEGKVKVEEANGNIRKQRETPLPLKLIDEHARLLFSTPETRIAGIQFVYDMFSSKIKRYALHVLRSKEASEDVLQEVMVKLSERGLRMNTPAHNEVMLLTNNIIDSLKPEFLRARSSSKDIQDDVIDELDTALDEEQALAEVRMILETKPQTMSDTEYRAFRMKYLEGLSDEEIIAKLGLPSQKSLSSHLGRGSREVSFMLQKLARSSSKI